MMTIAVFLDDERNPPDVTWMSYPPVDEWIIVRNYNEFVDLVDVLNIDEVEFFSFDHDIMDFAPDGTERTGLSCMRYLADVILEHKLQIPDIFFHTQNPCGKANMESVLYSLYRVAGNQNGKA